MRALFLLTLLSLFCFSADAQTDAAQQQTINYLKINGTQTQYEAAFDQMVGLIKNQFEGSGVPASQWEKLEAKKSEAVSGIVNMLASVYRSYFEETDIQNLYTHYSSSPEQQRANQNTFINSATGQKLVAVQQSLIQNISAASESWSRDLYMDTINELKALGYAPKQQ
ncbi:hypothetical protein BTO09_02175 [Gilvibacter sp. SZ-19]|uniref:DUF2059 domain-containing protein n=1 Tax=Gilvibacter sp. SZ-19 TaxID=754429 RepID=UPI000B3CAC43|nr:hypothetical protein [Gilvibacter sp. SZ-19]ARV11214.1 hypothetical protein BTO09_02175 [Gilvibacter sp. SZ-19]